MPLDFFSPNSSNTGAALFVSFNSKDGAAYFKLIQQTSWNAQTKKGEFKGGKIVNIKFSPDEVGSFIEAVRNKGRTSFYHSFGDEKCTGTFTYYFIEQSKKEGFGLTVDKDGVKFKVGFTLGSAERFMEYLRFAFDHMFSAIYSADKKEAEAYQKSRESNNQPKQSNKKKVEEPEPEPDPEEGNFNPEEDF